MRRTNAAATWRWPARTKMGSVWSGTPRSPLCGIGMTATPSPSMERSRSSKPVPCPNRVSTVKTYSPSAGKSWVMTIPPRVPNGVPSMWSQACCDTSIGLVNFVEVETASGLPTARRLTSVAARMYEASNVVDSPWAADRLSKLPSSTSAGSQRPASISRSSMSRMTRSYSARLSRWKRRIPGLGRGAAASSTSCSSVSTSTSSVSPAGRGIPGGGIIPARSLRIMRSAVSAYSGARATSNPWSDMLPVSKASL